jgi:acyl carrier protein
MLTEEQVIAAVRNHSGADNDKSISLDEDFSSLNIDSLDVFDILLKIESLTGTKIPDEDASTLTSARAILDYFNSK